MFNKQSLVSVIILNYNGMEFVDRCLRSVLKTDYPSFEVIFVDNASTDGSLAYTEKSFSSSHLRFVVNDRNYGFARGNNIGFRNAKGDYVVFLNMDTEVEPNWLKELVKVMESDQTIGAAQSKLLLMHTRGKFDTCGHMLTPFGFTFERGSGEDDNGQYDYTAEIFGSKGASMIVKREVLNEVGVFDPDYFALVEETDLCWRIWLRGYRVVFVPKSVVYHVVAGARSSARSWRGVELFYWHRNQLVTLLKNMEFKNLVEVLTLRLLLSFIDAFVGSVRSRNANPLLSLVRANIWVIFNFRSIWEKRKQVQYLIRRKRDKEIIPHIMVKTTIMGKLRERAKTRSAN